MRIIALLILLSGIVGLSSAARAEASTAVILHTANESILKTVDWMHVRQVGIYACFGSRTVGRDVGRDNNRANKSLEELFAELMKSRKKGSEQTVLRVVRVSDPDTACASIWFDYIDIPHQEKTP